ncbi:AAA family ATPase [Micromonospora sp. NPDC049171]|uniref:AAA family ATPase n=1 Tax=Micromonospora sp. NPDC049171 TaxID=3155770 RepID=UPI0033C86115
MEILVVERGKGVPAAQRYPFAVLIRNNWDDDGFKTSFFLEVHTVDHRTVQIGMVKILERGQASGATRVPTYSDGGLGSDYCSLGQELTYYETLKSLGREVYQPLLTGLRDVIFRPAIRATFANEPGFVGSLERAGSSVRAIEDAAQVFDAGAPQVSSRDAPLILKFRSRVGGSEFVLPLIFNDSHHLPDRMNAIIGYNGTGKTRLLANLAMVAHADPSDRSTDQWISSFGRFVDDEEVPFGSVIAVSYSAFDTFEVPGKTEDDQALLERSGAVRGYVYCGLRSFAAQESVHEGRDPHRLKGIQEISEEFFRALERLRNEPGRSLIDSALAPIAQEPSFQRLGFLPEQVHDERFRYDVFPDLSTGHKIVLNMVTQLSAHLQKRSLVLIDEPESHLHPPLLAALLRSISILLKLRDSFAVIATHAPVVLQEIPRRYVRVLRRFDDLTLVEEPDIETFGENVGLLTREVFNLDSSSTDYQSVLRKLAREFSVDEVEELFDLGLSVQARSFVASVIRSRR